MTQSQRKFARDFCSPMRIIVSVAMSFACINLFFLYLYIGTDEGSYAIDQPGSPDGRIPEVVVKIPPYTRPPYEGPPNYPDTRRWTAEDKKIPKVPRYADKLKGNYLQTALSENGFPSSWTLGDRQYDCSNGECALDKFPECSWNGGPYLHKPLKSPELFKKMVRFLNWSNITYFLITGSALGAVRNGGVIPGDGDIDVVFPVWLQDADFGELCADAREPQGPVLRSQTPNIESSLTLCGRTRNEWVSVATDYLKGLGAYPKFRVGVSPRKYGGFRLVGGAGVDFVVSIYDQAYVNGTREGTGGICRCEFSGIEALTLEDSWKNMERIYGENWIFPRKEPAHARGKGKRKALISLEKIEESDD